MAKMVVTFIHSTNTMKIQVTEVRGKPLGSLVKSSVTIVTAAMIAANGKVVAKPHPCVCGFMTLIHTHISTPMYGFLRMEGSRAKTITVTRMSLMSASHPLRLSR